MPALRVSDGANVAPRSDGCLVASLWFVPLALPCLPSPIPTSPPKLVRTPRRISLIQLEDYVRTRHPYCLASFLSGFYQRLFPSAFCYAQSSEGQFTVPQAICVNALASCAFLFKCKWADGGLELESGGGGFGGLDH